MRPDPAHAVQEGFDFLILLNIILSISEETFLEDVVVVLQF